MTLEGLQVGEKNGKKGRNVSMPLPDGGEYSKTFNANLLNERLDFLRGYAEKVGKPFEDLDFCISEFQDQLCPHFS